MLSCVIACFCVLSGLAAVRLLHTMPPLLCYQCYPVLSCVFVCYQGWQRHSYIPCLLYCVINVIPCYRVFLCVIRVGSGTVTFHASFTVLSMLSCVIRVGSSSTVTYHASYIVLSIVTWRCGRLCVTWCTRFFPLFSLRVKISKSAGEEI